MPHRTAHRALADSFNCLVLDCDGVLWRGSELIDGSPGAVQELRRAGRQLTFVTNASARSRAAVAERITRQLGVPVGADEVVTSGSVAAAVAAAKSVEAAFVIGAEGLREEVRLAGVAVVNPPLPAQFDEAEFRTTVQALPSVGAVIVGHDEAFSYAKLAIASWMLQRGGETCAFIGTNPDVGNRDPAGYLVPEAGALIAALEAASGRPAQIVGKPSPEVIRQLLQRHSLEPGEVLVVGDRLDTDIRFGANGGVRTCLVLTGVNTRVEAEALPAHEQPDFVRDSIMEVVHG